MEQGNHQQAEAIPLALQLTASAEEVNVLDHARARLWRDLEAYLFGENFIGMLRELARIGLHEILVNITIMDYGSSESSVYVYPNVEKPFDYDAPYKLSAYAHLFPTSFQQQEFFNVFFLKFKEHFSKQRFTVINIPNLADHTVYCLRWFVQT